MLAQGETGVSLVLSWHAITQILVLLEQVLVFRQRLLELVRLLRSGMARTSAALLMNAGVKGGMIALRNIRILLLLLSKLI